MRVLVACEKTGTVRDAFIRKGHEAWSCDLQETTAPGPHIKGDCLDVINDGWDLIVAHPMCTYLTVSAAWAFDDKPMINGKPRNIKPGTLIGAARREARAKAIKFVSEIWSAKCDRVVIENPVGCINTFLPHMPKPQIVQPYEFGHDASKKTCLWMRGVAPLIPTKWVNPRMVCRCGHVFEYELGAYGCPSCRGSNGKALPRWGNQTDSGQNRLPPSEDRWQERSATYAGIAEAMAERWG